MDSNSSNKIVMDCPICNQVHEVEFIKRNTQGLVKGDIVEYIEYVFRCPLQNDDAEYDEWVPAGLMDKNLARAHQAYELKKGLIY